MLCMKHLFLVRVYKANIMEKRALNAALYTVHYVSRLILFNAI